MVLVLELRQLSGVISDAQGLLYSSKKDVKLMLKGAMTLDSNHLNDFCILVSIRSQRLPDVLG